MSSHFLGQDAFLTKGWATVDDAEVDGLDLVRRGFGFGHVPEHEGILFSHHFLSLTVHHHKHLRDAAVLGRTIGDQAIRLTEVAKEVTRR